ncbi:MAG TPA: chorismate mutase [Pseudonocardiaceae bacterium]
MGVARILNRILVPAMIGAAALSVTVPAQASALPHNAGMSNSYGGLGPLVDVVIQRLQVSDQVAAAKFGTGAPIDDPVREQQELDAVRQSAITLGIDPDMAVRFFQQQIAASKVVQRGLFDRWTKHPDQAPTTRPDLGEIRVELDQITTELLQQLVAQRVLLSHSPNCQVALVLAAVTGAVHNHLDGLHTRALNVALSETCAA